MLGRLQDFLLKTLGNREAKKKMSSTNAKALNTMRQRLKKHNVGIQDQIDTFREHPESSEEEDSADSDLDEDASDSSDSDASAAGACVASLSDECRTTCVHDSQEIACV